EVERIAERIMRAGNVLYLGRGYNFPVALEGALKLKEISYIHAEGYPAAEMKHGPIALIDDLMPVVFLAPKDAVYQKVVSNVEEVKARGGRVAGVGGSNWVLLFRIPRSASGGWGMRVVVQRVSRAEVRVDGRVTGKIGVGLLVLAGFAPSDNDDALAWMADKLLGLRVFGDAEGKMNLALADVHGAVLVVSQFTLYGDVQKGRRPSFIDAAPPELAVPLYERFVALLKE